MRLAMMEVVQRTDGNWWVTQPGWNDFGPFARERDAEYWANCNIDDQVTGEPNSFSPELRTRAPAVRLVRP